MAVLGARCSPCRGDGVERSSSAPAAHRRDRARRQLRRGRKSPRLEILRNSADERRERLEPPPMRGPRSKRPTSPSVTLNASPNLRPRGRGPRRLLPLLRLWRIGSTPWRPSARGHGGGGSPVEGPFLMAPTASRSARRSQPRARSSSRKPVRLGLEGIVSKRAGSLYRSGTSRSWLKSKNPAFVRT
jgi:hypothetical protein